MKNNQDNKTPDAGNKGIRYEDTPEYKEACRIRDEKMCKMIIDLMEEYHPIYREHE